MSENLPKQDFKEAVKALNEVLKKEEMEVIKLIGVKKEVIKAEFTNVILDFIEKDKVSDLPDNVINFYNDHIANAEETEEESEEEAEEVDEDEEKSVTSEKKVKKTKKTKKTKKQKTTKSATKKGLPSENTREKSCVDALRKGGSFDEVVAMANDIYVEGGGSENIKQSGKLMDRAVKYLYFANVLEIKDGQYKLK